jgi:hypothetical protein
MDTPDDQCVYSCRPLVDGRQYDLSVYQAGGSFYGTWLCPWCSHRGETPQFPSQIVAYQAPEAAIEAHVETCADRG